MDPRLESILKLVVEEYIATAEPVGSKLLCEKYSLDVSPATVRNAMAALEEHGFLRAPHTSAGRIPTEQAFIYYFRRFVQPGKAPRREVEKVRAAVREADDDEQAMKAVADTLSQLTGQMAVVTTEDRSSHHAGAGNLIMQPDFFADEEIRGSLARMVNQVEAIVRGIFHDLPHEPQVLIGRDNPFGKGMASMVVKFHLPNGHSALLCLVGPMRMDYSRNLALLEQAVEELADEDDE